jgi:3-methyladenine DNA glycosylase AlkD
MESSFHLQILRQIKEKAGKPTQHTYLDNYLGNQHPRYAISSPMLRQIAKEWMKSNIDLSAEAFAEVLNDLIHGESSTEKWMAGLLLDYSKKDQRKFDPTLFDKWLDQLEGWAEIDAVCTNKYSRTEIVSQWKKWKPLLIKFSKSENISKRRASIVFFCSPLSHFENTALSDIALQNVDRLKSEKNVLITKAISWVLRSMIKYNRSSVEKFLKEKGSSLPRIAVRETMVKLETGRKTKPKPKK